jgi:hypothetical protein
MITAEKLKTLISLSAQDLTNMIRRAGYKEDRFLVAEFLGMTNGGQFCYKCLYPGEFKDTCKVFVCMDSDGTVRAEY